MLSRHLPEDTHERNKKQNSMSPGEGLNLGPPLQSSSAATFLDSLVVFTQFSHSQR
jgi:hypothetical protein